MAFRPGNHDRAWNDPPVFSYQQGDAKPEENGNTAKKTLLNKRVAFPLSGGSTTSQTPATSLPPIGLPPPAVNLTTSPQSTSVLLPSEKPSGTPMMETREQLESSLATVSRILVDSLTNYVESEKQEDFNKRLQHLFSNWKDGKLNLDVRQRLETMCTSLEKREFTKAENVRVALAVDYTSECASWIMVIKNIVTQMETKQVEL
ncbi:steroid receptor RNA activator 1-like protein [Daphnia pulex]|uniref:Steroid receptor RNA activator 1-like protein n=1 Tax=Daphnia pulex TaxID=6669 RepID=E9FSN0_DAPPU|nr:steroid receptor RNA activator 1-like protein [Daphnia pulex]|eukprot:EFX89230.1 steroid receptor RNA activator 1-like protein [Daphnia pulex]